MTPSTHPAVAAIPPDELFRDGLVDVRGAMSFMQKSRVDVWNLMRTGVLPWRRGRKNARVIPRRALAALLQAEWEAGAEPAPLPVPG